VFLTSLEQYLSPLFVNPTFQHYALVFLGTVTSYLFSLNKGFEGSVPFLKKQFINRSENFYSRLDLFLSTIFGSILVLVFIHPSDAVASIMAGLSWVGTLNTASAGTTTTPSQGTRAPNGA
jgi:hypothetical protein